MTSSITRLRVQISVVICQSVLAASIPARAEIRLIPHPAIQFDGQPVSKQLGDFGESFVDAGLRARGFEVIDGNVGVNGIDRIAVKRATSGQLTDIRFIEVKTRQTVPDFSLAITKNNGTQLSELWTSNNLRRIVANHPEPRARRLASEILEQMKARPEIVRRELHGIAVESNKYVIMNVDNAGQVTGVAAEGRLTSLLKMLGTRGSSEETRVAAIQHLAQFDQLRTAVAEGPAAPAGMAKLAVEGVERAGRLGGMPAARALGTSGTSKTAIIVQDAKGATNWVVSVAKQPGVLAAGITFTVDETFTGWEYHQGKISSDDFQRRTVQNGIKAAAVGVATQLVYILAPTPQGLVLIGVGVVAYVTADQAVKAYDAAFVPEAPAAAELNGIVPSACISTPMIDDLVASEHRK